MHLGPTESSVPSLNPTSSTAKTLLPDAVTCWGSGKDVAGDTIHLSKARPGQDPALPGVLSPPLQEGQREATKGSVCQAVSSYQGGGGGSKPRSLDPHGWPSSLGSGKWRAARARGWPSKVPQGSDVVKEAPWRQPPPHPSRSSRCQNERWGRCRGTGSTRASNGPEQSSSRVEARVRTGVSCAWRAAGETLPGALAPGGTPPPTRTSGNARPS